MRLTKIKLRGAIGIKKGLGQDEVEIDFTQFGPGLIALIGANGSGKTTLMENMHFYRTTVSHEGSLQSQFFLKDSRRIVEGIHRGIKYEGNIKIDALTDACEAYLFRLNSDGTKVALNDGLLGTYDEALEKVMDTEDLFFNSAFAGQKSKGIANLKIAERRKLFYELLDLIHYELKCKAAKDQLAIVEKKLADIEGQIRALTNSGDEIEALQKQQADYAVEITIGEHDIELFESSIKLCRERISKLEIDIASGNEKLKANKEIGAKIQMLESDIKKETESHNSKIKRLQSGKEGCQKLIELNKKLIADKDKIEFALSSKALFTKEREIYLDKKNEHNDLYTAFQKNYTEELKGLSSDEKEIQKLRTELQSLKSTYAESAGTVNRAHSSIETISSVPCDTETGLKCKFLTDAYKSKEGLHLLLAQQTDLSNDIIAKEDILTSSEKTFREQKQLIDERYQLKDAEFKSNIAAIETNLKRVDSDLAKINAVGFEDLQKNLLNAENEIEKLSGQIKNTDNLINELLDINERFINKAKHDISDLNESIDTDLENTQYDRKSNLHQVQIENDGYELELKRTRSAVDSLKGELSRVEAKIQTIQENLTKVDKLEAERAAVSVDIKEWQFLVRAFDKTGIPVLKLENSGPAITKLANDLLNFYNDQSRIKIETTKPTKDKKKVIESFDIIAIDKHGIPGIKPTMDIKDKSGGEKVWYQSAIQGAISIFKNQGNEDLTVFFDEQDGPLDSLGAVERYFEMLSKVHVMTKAYQTILITHRPEIIDLIPQQIKLHNGILQIIN